MSDIVMTANGLVAREADTAYLRFSGSRRGRGVGAYSKMGAYKLFLPLGWAFIRGGC